MNVETSITKDFKFKQKVASYRRQGHLDAIGGLAFPREYDSWHPDLQLAYENGRLMATNARQAGISIPAWAPGVVRPRGYDAMIVRANTLVGGCATLKRQPPDLGLAFKVDLDRIPLTPKRKKYVEGFSFDEVEL